MPDFIINYKTILMFCFTRKTIVGANLVRIHLLRVKPIVLRVNQKYYYILIYCFTRIVNCYTRKDKCFKCDNDLCVTQMVLRVKHLTLLVKQLILRVKQCIKI